MANMEEDLTLYVNGTKVSPGNAKLDQPLVLFLRNELNLMGTKAACGSGYCGACTVMVSSLNDDSLTISHAAMNSCLLPLVALHGKAVTTVEAVGSTRSRLHPVQRRLAESHGTQCGYCSPGMVMSMYALLRTTPKPSMRQMEDAIAGNLCRCTGYRPIAEGFMAFCQDCPMGEVCCQRTAQSTAGNGDAAMQEMQASCQLDPTQEPIFPSDLKLNAGRYRQSSVFESPSVRLYRPQTLQEVLRLLDEVPNARVTYGYIHKGKRNSILNKDEEEGRVIISCVNVRELGLCRVDDAGITVGAAVSISALQEALHKAMSASQRNAKYVYAEIVETVRNFGGKQFRNMMTVGDILFRLPSEAALLPMLICAECDVTVVDINNSQRTIKLAEILNNKSQKLYTKEVVLCLHIPPPKEGMVVRCYRVTPRKRMTPAQVACSFQIILSEASKVDDGCFVTSGVLDQLMPSSNTIQYLKGKLLNEEVCDEAIRRFREELLAVDDDDHDDDKIPRVDLAVSLLFKFFSHVMNRTSTKESLEGISERPVRGSQIYDLSAESVHSDLGRPIPHHSARQHTTGEAEYIDDIPHVEGELAMALVLSTVAHGNILSVDASRALAMTGVVDFIDSNDVPGSNNVGLCGVNDEEVFATKEVNHIGAIIGAILADSAEHARAAAKEVDVRYEELPHILTIKEAIEAESFYDHVYTDSVGDTTAGFEEADIVVEESVESGGQLHVPLEKGVCLIIPRKGDDEMEVWVSIHDLALIQVSNAGGSFGGKEETPRRYAIPTAIAAWKHMRPVRCTLSREEDALLMSTRHPAFTKYKVGCTKEGKVTALTLDVYLNAGSSLAVSGSVLDALLAQIDGAYKFPNFRAIGRNCRTNIISPTAFRGFGVPQALFITSNVIRNVARVTGLTVKQVQEMNFISEGETTLRGYKLNNYLMAACWNQLIQQSLFDERRQGVDDFNRENKHIKRGLSLEAWKIAVDYRLAYLQEGGALVNVYTDGTVLITHGGVEMGQGLHTKLIQVASSTLGIPHTKIHASETPTSVIPNIKATVGSLGSDVFGMAVHKACLTLNKRLKPIKSANPDGCWEDWVMTAFLNRVSLSATGFHDCLAKQSDGNNVREAGDCGYFVPGCVCTEVEVDLFTGTYTILRTDIVMDVGKSLNPAIDIGQIEGAFVQGAGLHTIEEVKWSRDGRLITDNYNSYLVPTLADVPREFNVTLLKESENPKAVYSSKGIGEPPFVAGVSVLFAIQDALYSALDEQGKSDVSFILNSPATVEKIRQICKRYNLNQIPK